MMKKLFAVPVIFLAACVLFSTGCATGGRGVEKRKKTTFDRQGRPSWYLNPPLLDTMVYGVGSAKLSNMNLARNTAVSRARDDIARQIEVLVESAFMDYAQESGTEKDTEFLQFVESVSTQVAKVTLKGSRAEEIVEARDGTIYALVQLPTAVLLDDASGEFSQSAKSAYKTYDPEEATKWLEVQITENPTQAGGG